MRHWQRRAVAVLICLCAVLLQVSVIERIRIADTSPDIVVLVIISIGLLRGSVNGAAYGFLGGLCIGLFAALPLGPHAILGTVVGYWAGRWGDVLVTDEHPVPPLVAGVCATFVMEIGRPLLDFLIVFSTATMQGMWQDAMVAAMLNAVLITPVYLSVRRLMNIGRDQQGLEVATS